MAHPLPSLILPPVVWRSPLAIMLKLSFVTLMLLLPFQLCYAVELPVVFTWDSLNSGYYTKAQTNKEISWDEYYRMGIQVDTLVFGQVGLQLKLQNHADFLKNYIELKEFRLSYRMQNWKLSAGSMPIGYGLRYTITPHYMLSPVQDDYLYQASRFNGASVAYTKPCAVFSLAMGGNVQNQFMAALNAEWASRNKAFTIGFTQEARAMDSHWRTPVAISAVKLNYHTNRLKLSMENALSYFPRNDATKEHLSSFSQIELGITPYPGGYLYLSAETNQLEPLRTALNHFQSTFTQDIAAFSLTPGITVDVLDADSSFSYHFLGEWRIARNQKLGIFYRREENPNIPARHTVGVQAELAYGI